MSGTSKSWLRDNAVNLIIASLLALIGWGGNEAFQYFKYKLDQIEARDIIRTNQSAEMDTRVTVLESRVDVLSEFHKPVN